MTVDACSNWFHYPANWEPKYSIFLDAHTNLWLIHNIDTFIELKKSKMMRYAVSTQTLPYGQRKAW
jgi:hypothetical protein